MSPREFFDLVSQWDFYSRKTEALRIIRERCEDSELERIKGLDADIFRCNVVAEKSACMIHEEVKRVNKILRERKENGS